jgi:hypothetical protein
MRDNMLVNMSGLEGRAMPVDLNIEHLIGELKVCIFYQCHYFELTLCRAFYKPRVFSQRGIALEISQRPWTF